MNRKQYQNLWANANIKSLTGFRLREPFGGFAKNTFFRLDKKTKFYYTMENPANLITIPYNLLRPCAKLSIRKHIYAELCTQHNKQL